MIEHELTGFDKATSAAHLRSAFPLADDQQASAFHTATGGTPRVQAYLLNQIKESDDPEADLESLRAAPRITLRRIFDDLWDAAVTHTPDPERARQHLAVLLNLARPVSTRIFGESSGLVIGEAKNFCRALMPGLVIDDDTVSFRDEDFETYLRDKLSDDELRSAHDRLGTYFNDRAASDPYAARHVADHLFAARRFGDAIDLVLQGQPPLAIEDNLLRLQVTQRRLALALHAAQKAGRENDVVRIILLAAEVAQSDRAVTTLVRENPDLTALYGDTESVARLYMREEHDSWLGSAHLRAAAMLARNPDQRDRAPYHLEAAEAWIRRWVALPKHERFQWQVSVRDIACGAEAIFWLEGAARSEYWLRRWRPPGAVLGAVRLLAASLARQLTVEELTPHLRNLELPPWAMSAILVEVWQAGMTPPRELVASAAERLLVAIEQGNGVGELPAHWAIPFCELASALSVEPELVLRIARGYGPAFPDHVPYDQDNLESYDRPLRSACLQAMLTGQDVASSNLLPVRYRRDEAKSSDRYSSERCRFDEAIGRILPAYRVRARAIVSAPDVSMIEGEIAKGLSARCAESGHRWFRFDYQYKLWALRACDALVSCRGDAESLIRAIADTAAKTVRAAAPDVWIEMAELLIRLPSYRPLAYELLRRAADRVAAEPYPGGERWQTLLRCATVASRYDRDLGVEYFQRGLVAAEGIDDDSGLLLSFQSDMARAAMPHLPDEDRRLVAARLVRLIEVQEPYVSETSLLPRDQILGTVAALDTPGGFALCSRWDDENRLELHQGAPVVVRTAIDRAFLSPDEGLAMLRLAGEHFDVSKDAVNILQRLHGEGIASRPLLVDALKKIVAWIYRDVPLQSRGTAAIRIIEWAEDNHLEALPGIAELRTLTSFASEIGWEHRSEASGAVRLGPDSESRVQELLSRARTASLDEVHDHLQAIRNESYGAQPILEYLDALGNATSPAQRPALLDVVVSAAADLVHAPYIAQGLAQFLLNWPYARGVRDWAPAGLKRFFEGSLPALLFDYHAGDEVQLLLSSPALANHSRAELLVPAVIMHLPTLGPKELYKVAKILSSPLPTAAIRGLLEWSLDRFESKIEADGRALPQIPVVSLPTAAPEVLGRFLWSLFGHPDKLVRWRALHSAYELIQLRSMPLLTEMMQLSRSVTVDGFRSPGYEFYPLSASTWLLVLALRLSHERPADLREYFQTLLGLATDPALPHAPNRELARRAIRQILAKMPDLLPSGDREQLQFVNAPRACRLPSDRPPQTRSLDASTRDRGEDRRFQFGMDTVPYWFSPLGLVFDCLEQDVTERAERWICDRWGRTTEDWWHDNRELGGRYDRRMHYHSHGTIPDVETLQTYLEYQAMCCAAGEMIDDLPVAMEMFADGPSDPWEIWLGEHLPVFEGHWLADMRGPTPFRHDCWGHFVALEEWLRRVDESEYELALGINELGHAGELVIRGHHEVGDARRYGTVRVSSALVSPDTAGSLLGALQAAGPHDFLLPIEDARRDDAQIDEPDFELLPWLREWRLEEGLDKFDPLARLGTSTPAVFRSDFLITVGAVVSPDRLTFRQPDGNVVGRLELWNDRLDKERASGPYSTGERLWVRLDSLLGYLRQRERDLIIEVTIARNRSEGSRREEGEAYDRGRDTIYLLRRDGSLETVADRRQVGPADSM